MGQGMKDPDSITIFRNADESYYTIVIDGRIVDSLGRDEALAVVACALLGANPPPYATGKTMQQIREQERERAILHHTLSTAEEIPQ